MDYRNELKFELSDYDLTRIKMRLTPLMYPDIHQGPEGYLVKSLYFDDLYDSCASEKENGILRRENTASGNMAIALTLFDSKKR